MSMRGNAVLIYLMRFQRVCKHQGDIPWLLTLGIQLYILSMLMIMLFLFLGFLRQNNFECNNGYIFHRGCIWKHYVWLFFWMIVSSQESYPLLKWCFLTLKLADPCCTDSVFGCICNHAKQYTNIWVPEFIIDCLFK